MKKAGRLGTLIGVTRRFFISVRGYGNKNRPTGLGRRKEFCKKQP